ncbi:MAG: FMN-binding protein [Candidatus Omnitrophica bacterium]|nr:FMN-binding protein [Candidatus Omnitrophota bacterium]
MVRLKDAARCIFILVLSAGVIFLTNALAQPEDENSLKAIMPMAERFEPVKSKEGIIYYKAYDKTGEFFGAAFKTSEKVYSHRIETLAGMLRDGTITSIKILSQDGGALGPDFTGQFKDKKDLSNIQAVSGATMSSKAVIDSVQNKAKEIMALLNQK